MIFDLYKSLTMNYRRIDSDFYESLLMGEQIAIGILEEQKLTFRESLSMTIPLFGGGNIKI